MLQLCFILGNTKRVYWYSNAVRLTSPSPQDCIDVISQLVIEIPDIQQHDTIYLYTSSPKSTLLLLSQIHQTEIRELWIAYTSLNEQHMYCITQCLLNNQLKRLHLYNTCTELTSITLSSLTAAVSINTSLETLQLGSEEITEDDISHISELLTVNNTLQRLYLNKCGISDSGIQSLSSSILHNNTLNELDLCGNQFTSAGIQYLFHLLTTNNTIKRLVIDSKHKSSSEQLKEYTQIKDRLVFLN